jgi:NADPH2:quinone reductase
VSRLPIFKFLLDLTNGPFSTPNDDQLVIKVVIAGSNPKDWKLPELGVPGNLGDDAAGYVHSVGKNVTEFKEGDRVAIFHEMTKPGGTFAEYALAWEHTTFHLPKETSFEEAATIPLAGESRVGQAFGRMLTQTML